MRILKAFLIFIFLFTAACENMYAKVYKKDEIGKINCFKVEGNDMFFNAHVIKVLQKNNINVSENCPYTLKTYFLELSKCNSPTGKSVGADFDGYFRFTVFKDNDLIYRCQADYKGKFGNYLIDNLVKRMKKDLKIK